MLRVLVIFSLVLSSSGGAAPAPKKWQGTIPKVAEKESEWRDLLTHFVDGKKYYSALTAALRVQTLFDDVASKEKAYRTLIHVIDLGYPYPLRHQFAIADLEPSEDRGFSNSYFFYKGWANAQRGLDRWAWGHFQSIDPADFPKYKFFQALQTYRKGKLDEAMTQLKELLKTNFTEGQRSLATKTARTLARIYFEKADYSRSLEIYNTYLLKVNPLTPSDWLEAAWNLYYLKRYEEALGYLYNLEAASSESFSTLERYVLRALVHREFCSSAGMQTLLSEFEGKYGETVASIKSGAALAGLAQLKTLRVTENEGYLQLTSLLRELAKEAEEDLPSELEPLANHFYKTEAKDLQTQVSLFEDEALERSAAQLITLHENIKFLKFDVEREAYSPEAVFRKKATDQRPLWDESVLGNFVIHWEQEGEFWRDERLKYRATIASECVGTTGVKP